MTYTYAVLEVSADTFREIADKLRAAGYGHAFDRDVIAMHGIALRAEPALEPIGDRCVCGEKPHHSIGPRLVRCACYVQEGNPPADWHPGCIRAYAIQEKAAGDRCATPRCGHPKHDGRCPVLLPSNPEPGIVQYRCGCHEYRPA
jgi:hypothetical protein